MYWIWLLIMLGVSFYFRYRRANPKQISYTQVVSVHNAAGTEDTVAGDVIGGELLDLPDIIIKQILESREEEALKVTFLVHFTDGTVKKATVSNQNPMYGNYYANIRQKESKS